MGRFWRSVKREPFAIGGFVTFLTLATHYGTALWTLPIVAVGYVFAFIADELWQESLDSRVSTPEEAVERP